MEQKQKGTVNQFKKLVREGNIPGLNIHQMKIVLTGTDEEIYEQLQKSVKLWAQVDTTESDTQSLVDKLRPLQILQNIETEKYYQEQLSKPMYSSLEEILSDMQQQKRHLTIMEKLSNTIEAGKYIQDGTD